MFIEFRNEKIMVFLMQPSEPLCNQGHNLKSIGELTNKS